GGGAVPGGAPRAVPDAAAAVARLARPFLPDEAPAHPAPDPEHHAAVLVAQHARGRDREEPLGGVDVRPADPGGVDRDEDLSWPRRGLRGLVQGEPVFAMPGRDLHPRPSLTASAPRAP